MARLKTIGVQEAQRLKIENDALRKEIEAQNLSFEQRMFKEKSEYESTIKNSLKQ